MKNFNRISRIRPAYSLNVKTRWDIKTKREVNNRIHKNLTHRKKSYPNKNTVHFGP
jgi:hypothetical protein